MGPNKLGSYGVTLFGVVGAYFLCRYQSARIDHYERERKKWRKGAVGECLVADLLGALSDDYAVINGVTTKSGDLDHIVVGPDGVFAIETKNWRGLVSSTGTGELKQNGQSVRNSRSAISFGGQWLFANRC